MFQVKLFSGGKLPTRGSVEAAGYDIYVNQDFKISPGEQETLKTGIKIALPKGYFGQLFSRSSLVVKKMIEVKAGTIDSDYRGEIKVILYNYGKEPYLGKRGDRIAQMIILKCESVNPVSVEELNDTVRGDGRFGSTGI